MVTVRTPKLVLGLTLLVGTVAFAGGFYGADALPAARPIAIGLVGVVLPALLALSIVTDTARVFDGAGHEDVVVRILAWLVVTMSLLALAGLVVFVYTHPSVAA
jgi:Na+/H+-dicarboxylate symporter